MREFWDSFVAFLEQAIFTIGKWELTPGKILGFLMVILVARFLLWVIAFLIRRRFRHHKGNDIGRSHAIISISKYFIYTIALLLALDLSGLDITVLIAGSTALFVGLGFGLQNTFNDFVSGIVLLFEGSLEIGDVVEVNEVVGRVIHIGLRTSKIISRDQVVLIIPNSKFVSDAVINWSHQQGMTRFKVSVGVEYGSDTELVKSALLKVANSHPMVAKTPKSTVFFKDFGSSSLDFELMFFTEKSWEAEIIRSDIRFGIDKAFREANITIPFPQRDLHIKTDFRVQPTSE